MMWTIKILSAEYRFSSHLSPFLVAFIYMLLYSPILAYIHFLFSWLTAAYPCWARLQFNFGYRWICCTTKVCAMVLLHKPDVLGSGWIRLQPTWCPAWPVDPGGLSLAMSALANDQTSKRALSTLLSFGCSPGSVFNDSSLRSRGSALFACYCSCCWASGWLQPQWCGCWLLVVGCGSRVSRHRQHRSTEWGNIRYQHGYG